MMANGSTTAAPPAPAPPPAPDATPANPPVPIAAPVSLENLNTLDVSSVVLRHMWQEYHWKAPTNIYVGKTDDDKKVVENKDSDGRLNKKVFLNTAFHEWAMATVEVDVPADQKLYMRWWLEDMSGNVIEEHPDFSKTNFDGTKAVAQIKKNKYGWRWDGRKTNAAGQRVFMRDDVCWSRINIKSDSGKTIALGALEVSVILVKGEPYKIWVRGVPKTDAEMDLEKTNRGNGRWLHSDGAKLATDCWIKVYRGVADDDGFLVFLGHGAIEATGYSSASA